MDERSRLYVETEPFLFERRGYETIMGPKAPGYSAAGMGLRYLIMKRGALEGNVTVSRSRIPYGR